MPRGRDDARLRRSKREAALAELSYVLAVCVDRLNGWGQETPLQYEATTEYLDTNEFQELMAFVDRLRLMVNSLAQPDERHPKLSDEPGTMDTNAG